MGARIPRERGTFGDRQAHYTYRYGCGLRNKTIGNHCNCGSGDAVCSYHCCSYTHTFNGPFPGLRRWAGTRKVKPIWILLKQETVSGSGISWDICKSAPCSRQTTIPVPYHSVFTGRMPFLLPNQQRQSTRAYSKEFSGCTISKVHVWCHALTLSKVTTS